MSISTTLAPFLNFSSKSRVALTMYELEKNPIIIVLVAKEQNRVVGFVKGSIRAEVSHLGTICVRTVQCRKCIGYSFLKEYIERSKRKEAHKVYLLISVNLEPAIRLYIKAGSMSEGFLRRHFYGMSMIIYRKFLK